MLRCTNSPLTILLLAINIGIFLFQMLTYTFIISGIFGVNSLFFSGCYVQPFTYMFFHASFLHLAMNMAVLFGIGTKIEPMIGTKNFALIYFGSGVASGLASALYVYYNIYGTTLGASGAICGLFGFLARIMPEQKWGIFMAILAMSFLPLFVGENIAWYGHIAGFLAGYFLARILR